MNPLIKPCESGTFRAGDPIPFNVELVVTIVAALSVRGMRAERFVHNRVHEQAGDNGAIGVMLYGKYGRMPVYQLQELMGRINIDESDLNTQLNREI